jgi:hypothetical protein
MSETRRCVGCGIELPVAAGPTHQYINSSPECWALFGSVLAREFSDEAYGDAHRLTVDAYVVQHPDGQPAKSLVVHLIGLHLVLHQGMAMDAVTRYFQRYVASHTDYPVLSPPSDRGVVTVGFVADSPTAAVHTDRVWAWAAAAWDAWSEHHDVIASLVES